MPVPESAARLANRLGLPFKNLAVLERALTHRSFLNENPFAIEDNERLEFLGDAVLDFLVGDWLYNHFPEMQEGQLTRMRSALVRTEKLAEFAQNLDLGAAMRLGRGERDGGGAERPSLLCATFEAVVGALYLNAGLDAVVIFVTPLLEDAVEPSQEVYYVQDPKGMLQEWAQAQGRGSPVYYTLSATGPEHERWFEVQVEVGLPDGDAGAENVGLGIGSLVTGRGSGRSKNAATKAAAQDALSKLST